MAEASSKRLSSSESDTLLGSDWAIPPRDYSSITNGYQRRKQVAETGTFIPEEHGTYLAIRDMEGGSGRNWDMDNPITTALRLCKEKVLKPYQKLLLLVGWHPVFEDPSACWQRALNVIHPLCVVACVVLGYVIQYAACFTRYGAIQPRQDWLIVVFPSNSSTAPPTTGVPWPKCQHVIISQYIIPDILHSAAYLYSFYLLRISQSEQLPTLMERVFLQTSPTQTGFLSQGKLIRTMRLLLYVGLVWVVLSLVAQILHVVSQFDYLTFTWMAPSSTFVRVLLICLMFLGFVALDVVYTAVVVNYCVQCSLLIFYIEGLQEKVRNKDLDLRRGLKEISEIGSRLQCLNYNTGLALSVVIFNFVTMAVLGLATLLDKNSVFAVLTYVSTGLSVTFWVTITVMPVAQAARLSAACNSLRKLGHEIRVRPFGFQDLSRDELDSFLLFTATLNMRAKIFLIPVRTSYLCACMVLIAFVVLLLFQTGLISIWL